MTRGFSSIAMGALLALLVGCGGTGVVGSDKPSTTPSPTTMRVTDAVLGSADFFAGSYDEGFGEAHPKIIYNGGDPIGRALHVTWTHWGEPTAYGTADGSALTPQGGYYPEPVTLQLRAEGLDSRCDGHEGYHVLWVHRQKKPGTHAWYPWHKWWGKKDLCGYVGFGR